MGVGYPSGYTGICGPPARRDLVPSAVAKGEAWPSSFLALPQVGQGGRMLGARGRAWKGGARLVGAPWWWWGGPWDGPQHISSRTAARKPVEPAHGAEVLKRRGVRRELGSAPG